MKHWLGSLRMTKKLLVAPFAAIFFLIVFGFVSYSGFSKENEALDDIFNNRFKTYKISSNIINDLRGVHANIYKMLGWISAGYDAKKIDAFKEELFQKIDKVKAAAEQSAANRALSETERKRFQTAVQQVGKYREALQQAATMDAATASILIDQADGVFEGLGKGLDELVAHEEKLANDQYSSAQGVYTKVLVGSGILLVIAVVLSLGIAIVMKSLILTPVAKMVEAIETVAEGNLATRVEIAFRDEIGEMAERFNAFVAKLHAAISHVAQSSNHVAAAATQLDSATEQMAAGIEEAAMQANSVATASEEMSKTSTEIAQNCVMAVQRSDQANASAGSGEGIVRQTIEVMNRISECVSQSARIIKNLGTRSDQIGQIVELISDVAEQTNLLALNAAIEAARAGEHGRGFAVVADEVRKLAERTGNATRDIRDTITAMQTETKNAVASMEEGVGAVVVGKTEAAKSGEALKDILSEIAKVTGDINQIAVASEEETAVTNEIAGSIQQISQVMQEMSTRIQENSSSSSQLAGLSGELQDMVKQFRL